MDGENNGKSYEHMDDLGGKPAILGNTHMDFLNMIFWDSSSWRFFPKGCPGGGLEHFFICYFA